VGGLPGGRNWRSLWPGGKHRWKARAAGRALLGEADSRESRTGETVWRGQGRRARSVAKVLEGGERLSADGSGMFAKG